MTQTKAKLHLVTSVLKTVACPLLVWIFFEVVDRSVVGVGTISSMVDVKALLRTVLTSFCIALALNSNLTSGRMDLSAGAQMYMGCIFGGNLALSLNLDGVGILLLSMLIGALCGLLVGVMFINLRILPMVLGIGMSLVFECLSFAAYNQQGLMLYGKPGVQILSNETFIIVVAATLVLVLTFLFQFSSFGYKRRAIQGSQKLASDAGINIYTNCVQCYVLAGALMACAGVFDVAYKGSMAPVMGMGSADSVFANMFPLFLGMWIGSFCNNQVMGVLIGSLSIKILTIGLSKLALDTSAQNIVVYTLFVIFQIFMMNKYRIVYNKKKKARIQLAQEERKKRMSAVGC